MPGHPCVCKDKDSQHFYFILSIVNPHINYTSECVALDLNQADNRFGQRFLLVV